MKFAGEVIVARQAALWVHYLKTKAIRSDSWKLNYQWYKETLHMHYANKQSNKILACDTFIERELSK